MSPEWLVRVLRELAEQRETFVSRRIAKATSALLMRFAIGELVAVSMITGWIHAQGLAPTDIPKSEECGRISAGSTLEIEHASTREWSRVPQPRGYSLNARRSEAQVQRR
jgi:hypothetical protein